MGSRFNVFFADAYDRGINDTKPFEQRLQEIVELKVEDCIAEAEAEFGEAVDDEDEFEFEGYSGDIASGEQQLIYSDDEFTLTEEQEQLLQNGNPDWGFPYDDEWFVPIRTLLEKKCEKWGPSLCVKINGRWAIMGFYSD